MYTVQALWGPKDLDSAWASTSHLFHELEQDLNLHCLMYKIQPYHLLVTPSTVPAT